LESLHYILSRASGLYSPSTISFSVINHYFSGSYIQATRRISLDFVMIPPPPQLPKTSFRDWEINPQVFAIYCFELHQIITSLRSTLTENGAYFDTRYGGWKFHDRSGDAFLDGVHSRDVWKPRIREWTYAVFCLVLWTTSNGLPATAPFGTRKVDSKNQNAPEGFVLWISDLIQQSIGHLTPGSKFGNVVKIKYYGLPCFKGAAVWKSLPLCLGTMMFGCRR